MNTIEESALNEVQVPIVFSPNTRVKKKNGEGSYGTVDEVREEINTSATDRPKAKKYLIKVRWDSGTISFFAPEALEACNSQ
jgi:hypothetical protein